MTRTYVVANLIDVRHNGRTMPGKRMFSKRQCVFLIVVLPMMIIPAVLILRIADKPDEEPHLPPRRPSVSQSVVRRIANDSAAHHPPQRPKPPKCFEFIWSGTCRDTCHRFDTKAKQRQRRQVTLKCDKSHTQLKTIYTTKQKYVYKVAFQDSCLRKAVDTFCYDRKHVVPNIVHYVWFGKVEFNFVHLLSFLSVVRFQNPCLIMMHADKMPKGPLWVYFLQISPKVIHVQRKQPKKIFRKKVTFIEHKADVAKLEALKEYGGIYLDTDQVLLRSLDKFRDDDATLGIEYGNMAANSILLAKKNALFVKLWYDKYKSYSRTDGTKHSNEIPYKLSQKFKDFVKTVGDMFSFPNAHQLPLLYTKNVDWGGQYGVHMHLKLHDRYYKRDPLTLDSIRSMNTTAGAISRFVVYGNSQLCLSKTTIQ